MGIDMISLKTESILSIAFFVLLCSGCGQQEESEETQQVPVEIYVTQPDSISDYVLVTGPVSAVNDVEVFSQLTGTITDIRVYAGDRVEKDEIVVIQDNAELREQVNQAGAAVEQAAAGLKLARQNYERMESLIEKKAITPQRFDQSESEFEAAQSRLKQSRTQLQLARERLENSRIRAPFDGQIAAVHYEEDQMLPAGQPVVRITVTQHMKALLNIPGNDIPRISRNQDVIARFPAVNGAEFPGYVYQMDQAVDPKTKMLEIEVRLEKTDERLKSGMYGEFRVQVDQLDNVVVLPVQSVLSRTESRLDEDTGKQVSVRQSYIYMIEKGRSQIRDVKTGILSGGRVEIQDGLEFGDSVIIVGQNIVKEGDSVRVAGQGDG